MHRRVRTFGTQTVKYGKELLQLFFDSGVFSLFSVFLNTVIKEVFFRCSPDFGQFLIGQIPDRTAQNSCQRNILDWIVQQLQVRQHEPDFRCRKISFLRSGEAWNSHIAQYFLKHLGPAADGAEQDYDVTVSCRSIAALFLIPDRHLSDQLLNPLSNQPCLIFLF